MSYAFYSSNCNPTNCVALTSSDTLYTRFGLSTVTTDGLMFDTTTPPTDGNTMFVNHYLKIVAFADGGEWDYLEFEVKV